MAVTSSSNPMLTRSTQFLLGASALLALTLFGCTIYAGWRQANPVDGPQLSANTIAREAIVTLQQESGYAGFLGTLANMSAAPDTHKLNELRKSHERLTGAFARLRGTSPAVGPMQELQKLYETYETAAMAAEANLREEASDLTLLATQQAIVGIQPLIHSELQEITAELDRAETLTWQRAMFWLALAGATLSILLITTLMRATREQVVEPLQRLRRSIIAATNTDSMTPLWGIERDDAIGDVARAVDLARYRFTQVPDITLISDQGPVRMKFEGESSSLFQELTRVMIESSKQMQLDSGQLAAAANVNRSGLNEFTAEMQRSLHRLVGFSGEQQATMQAMVDQMATALTAARGAQEQFLTRVASALPQIEAGAGSFGQVINLAHNGLREAVENLMTTERMLFASAAEAKRTTGQFAGEAKDLTEKIYAGAQLLRMTGEVMAEQGERSRLQLKDGVDTLTMAEQAMASFLDQSTSRLSSAVNVLEKMSLTPSALNADTKQQFSTIMSILMDIAEQMRAMGRTQATMQMFEDGGVDETTGQENQMQRALLGMNEIFGSLRERGDDVINRLNAVARNINND